jgi:hypothetical protein
MQPDEQSPGQAEVIAAPGPVDAVAIGPTAAPVGSTVEAGIGGCNEHPANSPCHQRLATAADGGAHLATLRGARTQEVRTGHAHLSGDPVGRRVRGTRDFPASATRPRSTMGCGCRPMASRPGAGHDCYRVDTSLHVTYARCARVTNGPPLRNGAPGNDPPGLKTTSEELTGAGRVLAVMLELAPPRCRSLGSHERGNSTWRIRTSSGRMLAWLLFLQWLLPLESPKVPMTPRPIKGLSVKGSMRQQDLF